LEFFIPEKPEDTPMRSLILIVFCLLLAASAAAQDYSFHSFISFEPARVSEPPELGDIRPEFPEAAQKNGIDGVVKVSFTLGADGKIHNATIVQDLPYGAGAAVKAAVQGMTFSPGKYDGKPVDINATYTYTATAFFFEDDKNIQKVKILGKPTAEYPAIQRGDGRKGTVNVSVTFYTDGKVVVGNTNSTMPREFDAAAKKAAAELKFEPATNKKTKKPVNQVLWVPFDFKP
jgi:TonB family protein